MELTVSNIPEGSLYRFDVNKYVLVAKLHESRDRVYRSNKEERFLEVYTIENDSALYRVASGTLLHDYGNCFSIRDHDKGLDLMFKVTMKLQELSLKDLYFMQSLIEKNDNKKGNK